MNKEEIIRKMASTLEDWPDDTASWAEILTIIVGPFLETNS